MFFISKQLSVKNSFGIICFGIQKFPLILIIFFITLLRPIEAKRFLIVSDIDDTIKDTEVLHKSKAFFKMFQTDLLFGEMPFLYSKIHSDLKMNGHDVVQVYLSNAPISIFAEIHPTFLMRNGFPVGIPMLRQSMFEKEHKIKSLRALINRYSPEEIILVGDNGENDPAIYEQFEEEVKTSHPNVPVHSFLRKAYLESEHGKSLSPTQIGFVSGGEIAVDLGEQGIISEQSVSEIINHSLADDLGLKLPSWINCQGHRPQTLGKLNHLKVHVEKLEDAIQKRCER